MVRLQQEAANLQQQVANRTQELATALKASMRFDYLARATTNGIKITDAEGRIEWVNAAWEKFSGYTLGEVQGRMPGEFLYGPGTQTASIELISEALREAQPAHGEMINYRKNCEPFWIEFEMQPMRDEAGKVANFFAIVSDITERKQRDEEQRRLHERLALALKALDCGVWDFDLVTDHVAWDPRQCRIFGVPEDFAPGSLDDFMRFVHPDDAAKVVEANTSALKNNDSIEYTFRIIRPDGAVRHISAHGTVRRDGQGNAVRMVGLDRDVTAAMELREQLRVAEERWQLALSGTNDGVWDADLETGRTFYDRRWAEIIGFTQSQVLA
jgi:PAS domain S-box-containing protein